MSTAPQEPPSGEKLILIVDDTPLNIGVISGALKDRYKTKVATTGQKALALACAEEKPDLILLDVRMPEMDGYEVCSRLKADPATREIPVIFLTGQTGAEEEARGFEVGGVDYVHKPFSPAVVKARVQTHLQLREAHETIARQLLAKDSELEMTRADQFRDKLSALGKLSAGLAHELNNPASAAHRAAERLRGYMRELRTINLALSNQVSSCEQLSLLASFEENLLNRASSPPELDALEQSDLEQEMESWLSRHDIANAARLASGLVEAGVDRTALDELGERLQSGVLSHALSRAVLAAAAERLTREIETSTGRISELVRAVKEYTYMDRAPGQEVDIHHGIESTLTMLKFRLKRGVEVKREFDRNLPRVFAHGSELNQVWTNLIDNAIDAMGATGELRIRTFRQLDCVVVEIVDNGSGIPDHVKPRVFEPFFTTKGVGQGTGIGLATVYRIVNSHRGNVSFDSRPGRTSFQVRLPIEPARPGGSDKPNCSLNVGLNLTEKQELRIRQSLESLAEFSNSVLLLFFDRLFELDPATRLLFQIPIEQQAQKLTKTLATIVEMLDRWDELRPQLVELGRRHAGYGVRPAQYQTMRGALMWAMAEVLEAEFDRETQAAWEKLLTTVAEVMLSSCPI